MKNLCKILTALVVIVLPLLLASCSKKDKEESGPATYTYTWEFLDYISTSATPSELAEIPAAIVDINTVLSEQMKEQFKGLGYTRTGESSFTAYTAEDAETQKMRVDAAIGVTKVNAMQSIQKLQRGARVLVRRNDKEFVLTTLKQ